MKFQMLKIPAILFVFLGFYPQPLFAKDFGLGVVVGSVTGISGNYFLDEGHSIDGAISYDLGRVDRLHIYGDYLWRQKPWIHIGTEDFGSYWGIGAKLKFDDERHFWYEDDDDDFKIGPRVVGGFNYFFKPVPIEVYLEGSLTLNIIPSTDADFLIGLGGRYYFE